MVVEDDDNNSDHPQRPHVKVKIDLKTSEVKSSSPVPTLLPHQIRLERVLGITVTGNAGLASAPSTGTVAYPAGCTVVLLNARKNRQSHIINSSKKTITAIAFSEDGRFLVTGECGHLPTVRIWDTYERQAVAEFPGHKFGINCVAFAPNGKYVVSVGSQHDMIVNVWDWQSNIKVASNKISTKVKAISFAENGNYFVTAGNRHIKFWYLEYSRSKYKEPVPLMGRSAILGEQRNNYFCDVACGRGDMGDSTFAITRSGLLCEFNNRRLLDKWVELRTPSANCLSVGEDFIFIGCADGIVRCFSPTTLQFITTLPRTHFLGVDVAKGLTINHMASHPQSARYPDAIGVTYDEQNFKVTVVYNDHSLYIWDVRDIKKVGKSNSFLFHSACIWGIETYPQLSDDQKALLPPGSFITCSSDDTIRIWNLSSAATNMRNIYSEDLLKIIYVDEELNYIKAPEVSTTEAGQKETTVYDQRNGVRCIRISPDGKNLASGDRAGNIRIHQLQFMDELCKIEAHDAEVLCLEYSSPVTVGKPNSVIRHRSLLASASRDRLIHVFDASRDYNFLHTLDDHSSSITSVKFLRLPPRPGLENNVQIVSCGADKSIIFRDVTSDHKGGVEFQRGNHIVGKTTLYDMEADLNHKHILTACQDRNIRVYTVGNGKHCKTFKGSCGEDGTLIKVVLDKSGLYIATSCTDKTLSIFDINSGECMATMFGHSELVTGLQFTNDCKHLITVSGDGCIFVWRLPPELTKMMITRLSMSGNPPKKTRAYIKPENDAIATSMSPVQDNSDYTFNVGKLPVWAKKQIAESSGVASFTSPNNDMPKGRWAQRVSDNLTVKSHYDSDSVIPLSESGNAKLQANLKAMRRSPSDPSLEWLGHESNEHDADIDEYSDGLTTQEDGGESTEPEHIEKMLFFGQNDENSSEYKVNAIDVDELRRNQRRIKKHPEEQLYERVVSNPSQESDLDDEEDERSTPNAENADRSITSMLSASSENVDMVGRRERFMRSNFESLSGANVVNNSLNNTISNKHREVSAMQRNAVTIARAQSLRDTQQNRKREELQKRIEETRRKLQNIGYRSMLRGSQSISDLSSHIPEKDQRQMEYVSGSKQSSANNSYVENYSQSMLPYNSYEDNNGLRRACSLSDLNKPSVPRRMLPAPPQYVSGRRSQDGQRSGRLSAEEVPSYMRSTSASIKKERSGGSTVMTQGDPRRRSSFNQTQSTSDLQKAVRDDDSSSEENSLLGPHARRRSNSHDRRGLTPRQNNLGNNLAQSDRDLTKVTKVKVRTNTNTKESMGTVFKQRTKMKTTTMIVSDPQAGPGGGGVQHMEVVPARDGSKPIDVVRDPLSWHLADNTTAQLQHSADNLVKLYKRITLDYEFDERSRSDLLQKLSATAGAVQQSLRIVSNDQTPHGELASAAMASINQILLKQGLSVPSSAHHSGTNGSGLASASPTELQGNPYFQHMLENYSNIMHQNVQQQQQQQQQQQNERSEGPPDTFQNMSHQGPSWC